MNCPKCFSKMEKHGYASIVVERCTNCFGIWFDAGEDDHLKNAQAGKVLDIGDPNVGETWSSDTEIKCPTCKYPMVSRTDDKQKHIEYETCPKCYGIFFDAGEFKDFEEETVAEYIKRLWS